MSVAQMILLALVSFVAGAINSVAGGGTLLTFPALAAALAVARQLSPADAKVAANATSTVALFPASVAALWGYRRQWPAARGWVPWLIGPSLLGGLIGALLLIELPSKVFDALVPWLILTAASLFALQPVIARAMGIGAAHDAPTRGRVLAIMGFQLLVAIYGGYFGAGIGILMLSALAMMGLPDIHVMNALKNLLGSCINGVAVVVFIMSGQIDWPIAGLMAVASMTGGYCGALMAQRTNKNLIRWIVIAIGYTLATWYLWQEFGEKRG
ncbi:MAG: sulfite exporter TauE/SafE family protein [Planctomycetes bacterium]|nr:sulfite exporter TauE/SafE family protein [Planctomycetota bacterium]